LSVVSGFFSVVPSGWRARLDFLGCTVRFAGVSDLFFVVPCVWFDVLNLWRRTGRLSAVF